jgi:hypothetical protein
MSRVGLADNSDCARKGVAGRSSECLVFSPPTADNVNVYLRNQLRHVQFASIPSQIIEANRNVGALSAGREGRFAAERGCVGFELAHLQGPVEATPTL